MDINPIDGPGGHPTPQTFESRTDEGGAAVTLINKTVVWFEIKTVLYNLRFQSRYLTGNGSLLGLLFRGDTSVEGNTECRHAYLLLNSLILPDPALCGVTLSSTGRTKRRSTRGSSRSKASASHCPLYRVVSWLLRTRRSGASLSRRAIDASPNRAGLTPGPPPRQWGPPKAIAVVRPQPRARYPHPGVKR